MNIHFDHPQTFLSRKRIRGRITQCKERAYASVDRLDVFINAVRSHAAQGDLAIRTLGTALTVPVDMALGNGRIHHDGPASLGILPLLPLLILEPFSPLACERASAVSSLLSAVPKAGLSALGNGLGGLGGALVGAYLAGRYKTPMVSHKPGEPCINALTFLFLVPTKEVAPERFFRCERGYGFDVKELQASFAQGHGWRHPHLPQEDFLRADRKHILQHPALDGRLVRKLTTPQACRSDISARAMLILAHLANPTTDDRSALEQYGFYMALPERERRALDAFLPMPHEKLSDALHSLVTGNYCRVSFRNVLSNGIKKLSPI